MDDLMLIGDVICIVEAERSINWRWEQNVNKIMSGVQIVSEDDFAAIIKENRYQVDCIGHIRAGTTLMKHPFLKDRYLDINSAEDILFRDKLNCMATIAKLLGVTRFEAKAMFLEEGKREMDILGNIGCKYVDLSAQYREIQNSKYSKTYCRKETFCGNVLNREAHDKALERAKSYGLYEDADIAYLLEQRNPKDENRLSSQEIKVELSRELNNSLDCAFSLNVLGGVFSLSANFKEITSQKKTVILETFLEF